MTTCLHALTKNQGDAGAYDGTGIRIPSVPTPPPRLMRPDEATSLQCQRNSRLRAPSEPGSLGGILVPLCSGQLLDVPERTAVLGRRRANYQLQHVLRQVLVLENAFQPLAHVGRRDGNRDLPQFGRLEGQIVEHALHDGVQSARADVLHP